MSKKYNLFHNEGYILLKQFVLNDSFIEICESLKAAILEEYKKVDKNKIGGHYMGNLGVYIGKYEKVIYNILVKNGLDKIINEITKNNLSEFEIIFGGNLNLPGGYDQHFHMDGSFHNKFIIVNLATENVDELNGPIEIACNTHKEFTPYWKFFLKNNTTKKLILTKGDIVIRKNELWHGGTKNNSNQPRFLLTLALKKKEKKENKIFFNRNKKIKICSNFFSSSFFGKIEEKIYTRLRFFYTSIRLLKSILKL